MRTANAEVFKRLSATLPELDSNLAIRPRCIATDVDEKKWLKGVQLRSSDSLRLGGDYRFVVAVHETSTYLISVGWEFDEAPADLEAMQINAGLLTAILAETDIAPIKSEALSLDLTDSVFYPSSEACDYYDATHIARYFPALYVHRVIWTSAGWTENEFDLRLAVAGVVASPLTRQIYWEPHALSLISELVRDAKCVAPIHLILRALTSNRPDGAFLEIYRCLEQLFPIQSIRGLRTALSLTNDAFELAHLVESNLGWRANEEQSLENLLRNADVAVLQALANAVGVAASSNSADGSLAPMVAKRVYKLRNETVHYRPTHAHGAMASSVLWPELSWQLMAVVRSLYDIHGAVLRT